MTRPAPVRSLAPRALAIALVAAGLFGYLIAYRAPVRHAALISCGALAALFAVWGAEIRLHGAAPSPARPKGESFDWGMHALRGFAILCILLFIAFNLVLAMLLKRATGRWSRMLTGA